MLSLDTFPAAPTATIFGIVLCVVYFRYINKNEIVLIGNKQ